MLVLDFYNAFTYHECRVHSWDNLLLKIVFFFLIPTMSFSLIRRPRKNINLVDNFCQKKILSYCNIRVFFYNIEFFYDRVNNQAIMTVRQSRENTL